MKNEVYAYSVRECPVCGKNFIPAPYHCYRYKQHGAFVCSWSCVLASESMKNEKAKKRKTLSKGEQK